MMLYLLWAILGCRIWNWFNYLLFKNNHLRNPLTFNFNRLYYKDDLKLRLNLTVIFDLSCINPPCLSEGPKAQRPCVPCISCLADFVLRTHLFKFLCIPSTHARCCWGRAAMHFLPITCLQLSFCMCDWEENTRKCLPTRLYLCICVCQRQKMFVCVCPCLILLPLFPLWISCIIYRSSHEYAN